MIPNQLDDHVDDDDDFGWIKDQKKKKMLQISLDQNFFSQWERKGEDFDEEKDFDLICYSIDEFFSPIVSIVINSNS